MPDTEKGRVTETATEARAGVTGHNGALHSADRHAPGHSALRGVLFRRER
jgi:hypothetical protein